MSSASIRATLITVGPAFAVALLYWFFLGYRRDYLGHYAAGYGGTLAVSMIVMAGLPHSRWRALQSWAIIATTLVCIFAGGIAEATVFRIAKFDEVDFCNQSLGAVLAGLVALAYADATAPPDSALKIGILAGIIYLMAGAYFAFT